MAGEPAQVQYAGYLDGPGREPVDRSWKVTGIEADGDSGGDCDGREVEDCVASLMIGNRSRVKEVGARRGEAQGSIRSGRTAAKGLALPIRE